MQPRILDAHRHARSDQRQQSLVFFGEVALLARLEVDHADHPVLHDQRNCQFRMNVGECLKIEIFFRCIGDQHCLASLGCAAGDALSHFHSQAIGNFRRISHVKSNIQFLPLFIEQKNGKDFVVDDLAHQFRHASQGGFQVERGVDHVGHFQQEWFHLGGASSLRGGRFHRFHSSSRCDESLARFVIGNSKLHCQLSQRDRWLCPQSPTLELQILEHADIREIAIAFRVVEAIADDIGIGNREADILSFDRLFAPRRLVEQRRDAQRLAADAPAPASKCSSASARYRGCLRPGSHCGPPATDPCLWSNGLRQENPMPRDLPDLLCRRTVSVTRNTDEVEGGIERNLSGQIAQKNRGAF